MESTTQGRTGPLAGMLVVELGTLIAGPFAGRLLGDMGARVIKIEDPGRPDPLRTWGQGERDGRRHFWTVHSRNKESITLDLRSTEGAAIFRELVGRADVLVENFRPGTLEKWGLGPDELHEVNPALVIGRVSGYGQTGPQATRAGYASVAEGVSGLRHLNSRHRGWHCRSATPWAACSRYRASSRHCCHAPPPGVARWWTWRSPNPAWPCRSR